MDENHTDRRGGGGRGLSGGWWFNSETRLGVVGQQFL